jgi:branched-chain amino acid transport system ATP-binding protein
MRTIIAQEGTSILVVEQNAALALAIADRAYLLETGRIVMSGPAAEIRKDEAVRRSYLGY